MLEFRADPSLPGARIFNVRTTCDKSLPSGTIAAELAETPVRAGIVRSWFQESEEFTFVLTSVTLAVALSAGTPDGERLVDDRACYTIFAPTSSGDRPIGDTLQTVERAYRRGRAIWQITVHQRRSDGKFDMRDKFELDGKTFLPLSLKATLNRKPHADLVYAKGRVTGFHIDRTGVKHRVDQSLVGPIWDGNLFGLTFATLPLSQGAHFQLPYFQYDHGLGTFTVAVRGSQKIRTPAGTVDAWVLDAGPNPSQRLEYFIEKDNRRELGYRSSQGSQRLGGLCRGLR
jgi:hypothetical protein